MDEIPRRRLDMPNSLLLPGVTAPAFAVLAGAWLVYVGTVAVGVGFALAGLAAWSYVN